MVVFLAFHTWAHCTSKLEFTRLQSSCKIQRTSKQPTGNATCLHKVLTDSIFIRRTASGLSPATCTLDERVSCLPSAPSWVSLCNERGCFLLTSERAGARHGKPSASASKKSECLCLVWFSANLLQQQLCG